MLSKPWLLPLLIASLCLQCAYSHICIITPRQRGPMDISEAGSRTCTRHEAPCGGQAPSPMPYQEVKGGQPIFIKWQQNLNHYDIGYPGYMDIAIAVANGQAFDPFVTMATVADVNRYDQGHQQNFTAVVTLPNTGCDHCVIRARYMSHKPGEQPFFQCSDIKITPSSDAELQQSPRKGVQLLETRSSESVSDNFENSRIKKQQANGRLEIPVFGRTQHSEQPEETNIYDGDVFLHKAIDFLRKQSRHQSSYSTGVPSTDANQNHDATTPYWTTSGTADVRRSFATTRRPQSGAHFYGFANVEDSSNGSVYLSINALTGERTEISRLPFGVDRTTGKYVTDGPMALDTGRGLTVLSYNAYNNMEAIADEVVWMNTDTGVVQNVSKILTYNETITLPKSPFSAMVVEIEDTYVTLTIEADPSSGGYFFVIGRLYRGGVWEQLYKTDQPESTYVNFLWAEYDISVKTLYVLCENENDPSGLGSRLYKFLVPPGHPLPNPMPFYSKADIDVRHFPFMSFHLDNLKTNQLYAISPGLWNQTYPAYHLVVLDVDTGAVTDVATLTKPGIFERYYGGGVFNGFNANTNEISHVLRVANTQADVIMHVNVLTKSVRFSQLTNLRNVKNIASAWNVR